VGSYSTVVVEYENPFISSRSINWFVIDFGQPEKTNAVLPNSLARSPNKLKLPVPNIIRVGDRNSNCI
jgi:hypothetical protein